MSKKIIITGFFLFFLFNSCNSQVRKIISVKVEFEGFFTETVIAVKCGSFRQIFKKTMNIKMFNKKGDIQKFTLYSRSFKKLEQIPDEDIRGVISFDYGNEKISYCFDVFGRFYNNGNAYENKKLLEFISNKLEK